MIAGRFWDGTPSPVPEVSIERSLHERFKIDVGDSVRFDVLGQPITATRHQRPRRELARRAVRRVHVRVQARRARTGAARLHRAAARARVD